MKAKQVVKQLNKLIAEFGDLDVVYSCDEEGNSFHPLVILPSPGNFSEEGYTFECSDDSDESKKNINAICIN
jgi:hypothetical protein